MKLAILAVLSLASYAVAQDGMPACDGDLTVVRVVQIKPGGSMAGFMEAVAAHQAWYRSHGFMDNNIVVSRVIVSTMFGGAKYSDSEVLTYHFRPPGMGNPPGRGDEAWNAYVKLYDKNSAIKNEYVVCMPKLPK